MAASGDIRERLSELWTEFGLTPDVATSEAQHKAAGAVAAWLEKGKDDPEIAIRAVQILLADAEQPGVNKRLCWVALRKVLTEAWPNAGTAGEHLLYAQVLLLAAWPLTAEEGWLGLAPLFDMAWDCTKSLERLQDAIRRWRSETKAFEPATKKAATRKDPGLPKLEISPFSGINFVSADAFQHVQTHQSQQHWHVVGPHVVQMLQDHQRVMGNLSEGLKLLTQQAGQHGQELATYAKATIQSLVHSEVERSLGQESRIRAELDLLWWGQARYCHAEAKPYRQMRASADVVLWWAAYEAAENSLPLETEPAAAYLVETLQGLGQDVFEKKSLLRWIEGLHATLIRFADKAPRVSERLSSLVAEDALGLPVTWTRLRAARKEPLEGAVGEVALDLDAEIDRGEWASWIFREVLLDLHLANDA